MSHPKKGPLNRLPLLTRRRWLLLCGSGLLTSFGCATSAAMDSVWVGHLTRPNVLHEMTLKGMQQTLADLQDREFSLSGRSLGVRHVDAKDRDHTRGETSRLLVVNRVVCLIMDSGVDGPSDAITLARSHAAAVITLGELIPGQLADQVIQLGPDPMSRGEALARYARKVKRTRALILPTTNQLSAVMLGAFTSAFQDAGGKVLSPQTPEQILSQVKQKRSEAVPDLIVVGRDPDGSWEGLVATGIPVLVDAPDDGADRWTALSKMGEGEGEGEIWTPTLLPDLGDLPAEGKGWVERFTKRFGHPPTPVAALARDAIEMIAGALDPKTPDDRRKLPISVNT